MSSVTQTQSTTQTGSASGPNPLANPVPSWFNQVFNTPSGPVPAPSGTSSTTTAYSGPGSETAQMSGTGPRLLADIDNLLNAHGLLGSLNVVNDIKVLGARAIVVGVGFTFGIAGLILVITAFGREVPPGVKAAAETTGGAALAAAAA